jgi:hypothetical protein
MTKPYDTFNRPKVTNLPSIAEILGDYQVPIHGQDGGLGVQLPDKVDLQGWNSDHEIFDRMVADLRPATIIEVGSWKGRSTAHFAKASAELDSEIIAVDTWLGGIDHHLSDLPQDDRRLDRFGDPGLYRQFLRNFLGTPEAARIRPLRQTSINGARILKAMGKRAGLVYVDGSHEYDDAYADLVAYFPLLAEGGYMFGDVIRFAHEAGLRIEEVAGNFWILR